MGAAISAADLGVMKHNGWTHGYQDGTARSAARPKSDALGSGDGAGQLGRVVGSKGGLTSCERWVVEARIARISASVQDLADQVWRLRQGGGPFAPGGPGSPSPAPRPA